VSQHIIKIHKFLKIFKKFMKFTDFHQKLPDFGTLSLAEKSKFWGKKPKMSGTLGQKFAHRFCAASTTRIKFASHRRPCEIQR